MFLGTNFLADDIKSNAFPLLGSAIGDAIIVEIIRLISRTAFDFRRDDF